MKKAKFDLTYTIYFVGIIFFVFLFEKVTLFDLNAFCLIPRDTHHWLGIFTMPLLHGSWEHLTSNIFSYSFISIALMLSYPRISKWVFWMGYIFTGAILWVIGRGDSCHIGASGLIYALAFFMIASGFIRKDFRSLIIAIFVVIFNSGLFAGMLPFQVGVSWEGHISGAIVGILTAFFFRNIDRQAPIFVEHSTIPPVRFFDDWEEKKPINNEY